MQFLNNYPKWDETITGEFSFYRVGKPSISDTAIIDILRSGGFPSNIRGNFAFFFKDQNRTVAAVDHLPNYNLFYSNEICGNIFLRVQETRKEQGLPTTKNAKIAIQIKLFWGGSVGEETTINEIKRVPPASYLEVKPDGSKKIIEYRNIYSQPTGDYNLEELSQLVENYIVDHTKSPFGLLLSSGTDSNTILAYFRKLGIEKDCKYISLKGNKEHNSEAPFIQQIADHYGIEVDWYNVGDWAGFNEQIKQNSSANDPSFVSAFHRTYSAFWTEPHALLKYKAVKDLGFKNRVVFTGEVGDQIFGSRFGKILLKFIIQNPNADVEQIAQLFLNSDSTRFNYAGYDSNYSAVLKLPPVQSAYNDAKQWFVTTWNRIETDDLVNKIELMQYFYKGSHRVYNYNQFPDTKFAHPFADSYVFDYVWRIPGKYKLAQGGRSRILSYQLAKDYMVEWPWLWPKTGVAVLAEDKKFESIRGIYNAVQLGLGKHTN